MKNYTAYFIIKANDGDQEYEEAGFIPADSYGEAAGYIAKYYGSSLGVISHLELLDIPMLTMSTEVAENFLNEIYF